MITAVPMRAARRRAFPPEPYQDSPFREQAQIQAARLRVVRTSRGLAQEQLAARRDSTSNLLVHNGRFIPFHREDQPLVTRRRDASP